MLIFRTGCLCQGFGSWGATGVASVWRDQGLSPCRTEAVPMDPVLLPKAEPVSNAGGVSVMAYLRTGKNAAWQLWESCPPVAYEGPRWRRYPYCSQWRTPNHSRWTFLPDPVMIFAPPFPLIGPGQEGQCVRFCSWSFSYLHRLLLCLAGGAAALRALLSSLSARRTFRGGLTRPLSGLKWHVLHEKISFGEPDCLAYPKQMFKKIRFSSLSSSSILGRFSQRN